MTDRTCGDCSACCTVLWIPQNAAMPEGKVAGVPCDKLITIGGSTKGCGIYDSRPSVCSEYRCVWLANADALMPRHMKTEEAQRPDLCGLMIGPTAPESNFHKATGIPLLAAYEVRPGGRDGYWAQKMLNRMAARTLVAIIPFHALTEDPRSFIGPAKLVHAAHQFAASVGGLKGTYK